MRHHTNARAARAGGKNVFYNFCLRVLLERVTHQVAQSSLIRFGEVRRLKVVIAETGGVKYDHTMEYIERLRAQALTGRTFLSQMTIHPKVASGWQVEKVSAKTTAGCQLADVVASAFYNGVNEHSEMPMLTTPALALERVVPRRGLSRSGHGVTLLPWDQDIPRKHRPFLAKFGYKW